MSVLAISIPVTETRKEAFEVAKSIRTAKAVETAKIGKDDEKNKCEFPNLARAPYIQYPIIF